MNDTKKKVDNNVSIKELKVSYKDAKQHHDEAIVAIPKIVQYMIKRGLSEEIIDIDSEYNEKKKVLKEKNKELKKPKYKIKTGKFSIGKRKYEKLDYAKVLDEEAEEKYKEIASNKIKLINTNIANGFIEYLINMRNCIIEKFKRV